MSWTKVAEASEVPPGHTKDVTVDGARVLVCNVGGNVYAVGDVCTHDDGPLGQGVLENFEVECPRHGARFDVRTGKALCLPAILPVPTYAVKVEGTMIFIEDTAKAPNAAKTPKTI